MKTVTPARSFAPDLIRGNLSTTWIYIVGPIIGAFIGVGFEFILKRKATDTGAIAAQGTSS
ncbi:MAG: aquaporin [Bacteroidia bacterium]|nr:aquaporin [Bacteroidia bacterium]